MAYPVLSKCAVLFFSGMKTEPDQPAAGIDLFELGRDIGNTDDPVGFLAEIVKGIQAGQEERRR